ncbi:MULTISPECIES: DUF1905 domain-containing protein [unclassified Deinococcus]|uniref:DUF1905 domain-containing protein n=1 Tax=unclassified Deinococcus TaxID=2623546 RepID=UPI001E57B6A8
MNLTRRAAGYAAGMSLTFTATLFEWRGPAPHFFLRVPDDQVPDLRSAARLVTYGWGMIPCHARVGETIFRTAIFPKGGGYLLPVKVAVRRAEALVEGQDVTVTVMPG